MPSCAQLAPPSSHRRGPPECCEQPKRNSIWSSAAARCWIRASSCAPAAMSASAGAAIAAVEPRSHRERARKASTPSGKLVLPGLVDMHTHVYPPASALGLPADELAPFTATATYVSAGDAGANNFSALRHFVIAQARTPHLRVRAHLHHRARGLPGRGGCSTSTMRDVDAAADRRRKLATSRSASKCARPRTWSAPTGWSRSSARSPRRRQPATGARVMCHIGDAPGELP